MRRFARWTAVLLAICLVGTAALSEAAEDVTDVVEAAPVEAAAPDQTDFILPADEDAPAADVPDEAGPVELAPDVPVIDEPSGAGTLFATAADGACAYTDPGMTDVVYRLGAGEAVLVAGTSGTGAVRVAFMADGEPFEGWMDESQLIPLDDMPVGNGDGTALPVVSNAANLANAHFTRLSNSDAFTVQGRVIRANMVSGKRNCWAWANAMYKLIWGVNFTSDFAGSAKSGRNMLRGLSDSQRKLTAENLKRFVGQAELGATLRITSCTSACRQFGNDSLNCGHKGHSLILAAKDARGMVVMDDNTGSGSESFSTRYYTWQGFADHWSAYRYIKYIKWPNAPEYSADAPTPTAEPIAIAPTSLQLTAGDAAQLTVAPAGTEVQWRSSAPTVAKVASDGTVTALKAGAATITAAAQDGRTAAVKVSVAKAVKPTRVRLSPGGTVKLNLGETLQLNPVLTPANARTTFRYKSSSKKIATVSTTGLVTPKRAGTATIAVATANGKTAKLKIRVIDPTKATKVTLDRSGTVKLRVGQTLQLTATRWPATATSALKWKTSKRKVARISSTGLVLAVKPGTATVGVITDNGKVAKLKIRVVK